MRVKQFFTIFLLIFLVRQLVWGQDLKEFKIEGRLELNEPVERVVIYYTSNGKLKKDSNELQHGKFVFQGKIPEPVVGSLIVRYKKGIKEDDEMRFLFVPEIISFYASDSFENYTITGIGQAEFRELRKKRDLIEAPINALTNEYFRLVTQKENEKAQRVFDKIGLIEDSIQDLINDSVLLPFLKTYPNSVIAMIVLREYAGLITDPDNIDALLNSLSDSIKKLPSAKELKNQIDLAKRTAIGHYAIDFTQNDRSGKSITFSFFKGKYVLIDFWASWCVPCRQANPALVKIYKQYKNKGFEILGISLERSGDKDKWLKAINDDGLSWPNTTDFKYWNNEVAKLYGITAIPQNLLINPEGVIVAKNLEREELEQFLKDVFKN